MKVNKILIPTDFSDNSHKGITAGNIFIDLFDCKVDLIHVVPVSSYLGESISNLGIPVDINNDIYPKIVEEANTRLLNFSKEHINSNNLGELFLPVDRKPHDAILDQAKKGNYDMIVMSAKGSDNSNFLHGSITEKVVRHSEIPVLVLDNHLHKGKIKTVMVPTDLSKFSFEVIATAFELATKFGANITFYNVLELHSSGIDMSPMSEPLPHQTFTPVDEEEKYELFRNRLETFFESYENGQYSLKRNDEPFLDEIVFTEGSSSASIFARTVIQKGITAHHKIIEYANDNADLMVLATHGKTGLERMLLGSTTEQIIQHLEMPMLTIKPDIKELA